MLFFLSFFLLTGGSRFRLVLMCLLWVSWHSLALAWHTKFPPYLQHLLLATYLSSVGISAEPNISSYAGKSPFLDCVTWTQEAFQKNQAFKYQYSPCWVFGKHIPPLCSLPLPRFTSPLPEKNLYPPCFFTHQDVWLYFPSQGFCWCCKNRRVCFSFLQTQGEL